MTRHAAKHKSCDAPRANRAARHVLTSPMVPFGTETIDDSLELIEQLYDYNHWVFSLVRPFVGDDVLEVGAGTGNITQFLAMRARRVVGVEPVDHFADRFVERFQHMSHVSVQRNYLERLSTPRDDDDAFDTVICCNVLEHIEDDVAALRQMAGQLRTGGRVVIFVPAGRIAFGRLDRELGHYRRYTLRTLRRAMTAAGLEWRTGRYSNALGLLGWFISSVVLRRTRVPAGQAKIVNALTPLLSAAERYLPLPFGQSVIGVATRPAPAAGLSLPITQHLAAAA